MQPIEIITIIACVLIVGGVLGSYIYKKIKHKPTGGCDGCGGCSGCCSSCSHCFEDKKEGEDKKEDNNNPETNEETKQ